MSHKTAEEDPSSVPASRSAWSFAPGVHRGRKEDVRHVTVLPCADERPVASRDTDERRRVSLVAGIVACALLVSVAACSNQSDPRAAEDGRSSVGEGKAFSSQSDGAHSGDKVDPVMPAPPPAGPSDGPDATAQTASGFGDDTESSASSGSPSKPGNERAVETSERVLTRIDDAVRSAGLGGTANSCISNLESDAGFIEMISTYGVPSDSDAGKYVPQIESCLGTDGIAAVVLEDAVAVAHIDTPTPAAHECAEAFIDSLTKPEIAGLLTGEENLQQLLLAECDLAK